MLREAVEDAVAAEGPRDDGKAQGQAEIGVPPQKMPQKRMKTNAFRMLVARGAPGGLKDAQARVDGR